MLLQTNAYSLPRDRQDTHARLAKRLVECFKKLGADLEVFQQVNESFSDPGGTLRYVQIMRFRDLPHLQSVRSAETSDPTCKALIQEFCELVDLAAQAQSGSFIPGYYSSISDHPTGQTR